MAIAEITNRYLNDVLEKCKRTRIWRLISAVEDEQELESIALENIYAAYHIYDETMDPKKDKEKWLVFIGVRSLKEARGWRQYKRKLYGTKNAKTDMVRDTQLFFNYKIEREAQRVDWTDEDKPENGLLGISYPEKCNLEIEEEEREKELNDKKVKEKFNSIIKKLNINITHYEMWIAVQDGVPYKDLAIKYNLNKKQIDNILFRFNKKIDEYRKSIGLKPKIKWRGKGCISSVTCYDKKTNDIIKTYPTVEAASQDTGICRNTIRSQCRLWSQSKQPFYFRWQR